MNRAVCGGLTEVFKLRPVAWRGHCSSGRLPRGAKKRVPMSGEHGRLRVHESLRHIGARGLEALGQMPGIDRKCPGVEPACRSIIRAKAPRGASVAAVCATAFRREDRCGSPAGCVRAAVWHRVLDVRRFRCQKVPQGPCAVCAGHALRQPKHQLARPVRKICRPQVRYDARRFRTGQNAFAHGAPQRVTGVDQGLRQGRQVSPQ